MGSSAPTATTALPAVRWGIIGCGDVVDRKAGPSFQQVEGSRLVAVMRRSGERAEDFARRHGVSFWTTDAEAVIRHPEVDAVYVATPPAHHLEYALRVCEAGKPCLVEKPAGRSSAECRAMVEAFRRRGLPLFVSYYRPHLPKFRRVKEILDTGRLGPIVSIRYAASRPAPAGGWRLDAAASGGGVYVDLAGHVLDLLDDWFGPLEPLGGGAVNALPAHEVEDAVALSFRTAGGAIGSAHWNFAATRSSEELVIEGIAGRLALECMDCESPLRLELVGPGAGRPRPPRHRRWLDRARGRDKHARWIRESIEFEPTPWVHAPMLRAITDALRGGPRCRSTGEAALRTARVVEVPLAEYYGGRSDAFWERPRTWRSLRQTGGRGSAPRGDYRLAPEDLRAFEQRGFVGPFRCDSPHWRSIALPESERLDLHLEDPRVFALCSDASVVDRVAQLSGKDDVSLFKTRIWSKPRESEAVVPWHQDVGARNGGLRGDGSPVPTLTVWLALDPVTRESGAVLVLPGSQRTLFGDWRKNFAAGLEASGALAGVDFGSAVPLETRPGEFWIFHSWILHSSPPNRSGGRRAALNMRFCARGDELEPEFTYLPMSRSAALR